MIKLIIQPKSCLQDEKVVIKATGLNPNKSYTFSSHLQDTRSKKYFSFAHYRADSAGVIDVSRFQSDGGHYKGVFQMGLIAALQPEPGEYKYARIFKRDVETPNKIEFRIYEDHKTCEEICSNENSFIINDFHFRCFMAPGVERLPIREGRVRGTIFLPPGDGPFPGVIDMFGTAGGLLEYRSAQLASRGVASLAMAYFDYEDLPKTLSVLDLSYFREAAHVLLKQPKVSKPYVGTIGTSKGGDLALSLATFIPEVSLAVSINGCCSALSVPLKVNESFTIPPLLYNMAKIKIIEKKFAESNLYIDSPRDHPESIIPIHQSNSKFLFIVGSDDKNLNSSYFASVSTQMLKRAGKERNYEVLTLEGAGHLIEPPYSPFCSASYHKLIEFVLGWGGELEAHTEAQEKAWMKMLNYIKTNLNTINSKL